MVHGEAEKPSFLLGRQAAVLNGAGLAILLARHVLVGTASFVESSAAQNLALGANQVVAVPGKVPSGDHAGLLPGMDRNVGGDVPFLQQFPQRTLTVAGIGGQGHRLQR